jgi:enamine deaminase RidA (YjgF/YER057c/UK114 family)
MYTTDIDEFSKNADVYKRHFINHPASTLVEVRRLIFPEMLVEIEAVALLPSLFE